jgi:PAS domain S-box-containing protein
MNAIAIDNLESILKKLPEAEQEQLTNLFNKQKNTGALHKELIKQLNQEMDLNRIVLNAAGDGIFAIDNNHKIINLNPALANMFGYEMQELKGQDLNMILPDKTQKHHEEKMRTFGDHSQVMIEDDKRGNKYYGKHKTKGLFKVSIAISHGVKANQKIYTGIIRDLSSQSRFEGENEKKTSELKNRTREIEGLYNLKKLGEGEESIPAIINKLFTEIVPKTTKHPDKAVTIIEIDDQVYRSREEEPVVALSSKLHNGSLTFGFTEDVGYGTKQHHKLLDTFTEEFDQIILQIETTHREQQAERRAAMGELSTGIASNINNGLQIILGYAQVSLNLATAEEMREHLRKIKNKTQELGASVRGILQSSNYTPGNYTPDKTHFELFDMGELLHDYLTGAENPFRSEALSQGITVAINERIDVDTGINGKPGETILIAQALIKNSIDSFLDDGQIDIDVRREGGYVLLQVKDNGTGMSEEKQKRLFDPYFTTKGYESGKGLSLYTAQKIAQEHGGEINLVKSRIGQGTTIELKLPYAQIQQEKKKDVYKEYQEPKKRRSLSILWADDDIVIREIVKTMTDTLDDQIDFAKNGKLAIDMLQQKNYDLLITDIGMPVMGGWELIKNIQGLYENIPRIVASGYFINTSEMEATGVDRLLNKPFNKGDIIKLLDDIGNKTAPGYMGSIKAITPEILIY